MRKVTKKQVLNEIMGVPKAIDIWVEVLTNSVLNGFEDILNNDKWAERGKHVLEGNIFLEKYIVIEDILEGFNASQEKDLLEDERFKGLPLWRPEINVDVLAPDKKAVDGDLYERVRQTGGGFNGGMGFGDKDPKLQKVNGVNVLPNSFFTIEILIRKEDLPNPPKEIMDFIRKNVKSVFSHELTHAYQHYMGLTHGVSGFGKEEVLNTMINSIKSGPPLPKEMMDFLHIVYLHLSFENNARVAQIYHNLKNENIDTKEKFLKKIKDNGIWKAYVQMKNFNAVKFLENFNTDVETGDSLMDLMINLKTNTYSKEKVLKDLIRIWQLILNDVRDFYKEKGIDYNMEDVPEKAMKNPYNFFKFWEKRFHKNAENYKRKLLRLGSLLINKN